MSTYIHIFRLPNLAMSPALEERHAFTCIYQLSEDVSDDYVYFQVATAHTAATGERILRVSTQRLAVKYMCMHICVYMHVCICLCAYACMC